MALFLQTDGFRIELCPICHAWHGTRLEGVGLKCALKHPPGSCCHYGEKSLKADEVAAVEAMLERVAVRGP